MIADFDMITLMFQGFLGLAKAAMWVGVGGALGAISRGAVYWALNHFKIDLPWGTLAVNLSGALLIGWFFGAKIDQAAMGHEYRLLFSVGFLGALTTFSTFSRETLLMMQAGQWGWMTVHVLGNNIGCLLAVWLGWKIAS